MQTLPQSEFKFFLINILVNTYTKKYENIQVKFEYKDFINRPIHKILSILYYNNFKIEEKLILEFNKNKSDSKKNMVPKLHSLSIIILKKGLMINLSR